MAKKEESISMVDSFAEFKELKNIDKTTMISVLEESFRNVLAKMFGSVENFVVIMNPDKGDCEIYQNLEVVADGAVENPSMQIGLTEARTKTPSTTNSNLWKAKLSAGKFIRFGNARC